MSGKILEPIHTPRTAHYPGALGQLGAWAAELCPAGSRLTLVTGRQTVERLPALASAVAGLSQAGWQVTTVRVDGEPSAEWVDEQRGRQAQAGADLVVAAGGGSALDTGKALAAMACEPGPVRAYTEGIGDRAPSGERLPWIAVPTTMGTGSEVTHNAVLGRPALEGGYKKSLRHPRYVADRVILDARLSVSLPPSVVASAGLDAYSQLLESYLAPTSSPLLDRWLAYGLGLAGSALPALLCRHGDEDLEAQRHDMALAAMLSGVALTYTGLGVVHGLIGPLGAVAPVGHGVACANCLPGAMRHTLAAARAAGGERRAFVEGRMARAASVLDEPAVAGAGADDAAGADALVEALEGWRQLARDAAGLPGLAQAGVEERHIRAVLDKASDRRNPVPLDGARRRAILDEARG